MPERFAIVTYQVRGKLNLVGLGFGYLVETPDGRAWCFPSLETRAIFPEETEAFELNLERLESRRTDDGRHCLVYSVDA
jgi:hypothetical protein